MTKLYLLILFLSQSLIALSQDYNYVHYDTKDGLAGSTVYDMCQDKDGFMWFATENGLSRFDGTNFKNFTVKDGLPDNEVLKIFADSKGRVWIGTFNKELCYCFKGKIYNKSNDKIIRDMDIKGIISKICETEDKNIAILDGDVFKVLLDENTLLKEDLSKTFPNNTFGLILLENLFYLTAKQTASDSGKRFRVVFKNNHISYQLKQVLDRNYDGRYKAVTLIVDGKPQKILPGKPDYLMAEFDGDKHVVFYNTTNGSWQVDTVNNKWGTHFLVGKKISRSLIDKENNFWFSTFGEGAYKLPSREIRTFTIYRET